MAREASSSEARGGSAEAAAADRPPGGVWRQFSSVRRAIDSSPVRRALYWLIAGIVFVVVATAYGQIRLNRWNKPFFDALSRRDLRDFFFQLGVFFLIVAVLLIFQVAQKWLVEMLKIRLREGLMHDLIGDWMLPRRAFWLANAGSMGVNPDQRMHEDARKLCELTADLGVGLFQASILFVTFAGILWTLSTDFVFRFGDQDYAVPGFMLWAAIAYAIVGSVLSFLVGRTLIARNAERYAREADLRFSLVRVNEHLDDIALASGEQDERRRIEMHLRNVLAATRRLVTGLTNLTWVTAGFGWVTIVAPILVAAPLYFTGKISFGGLMMAAGAFTQAQSSLRWFVDNFSTIADWSATLDRVASFRRALLVSAEDAPALDSRIEYVRSTDGSFALDDLKVGNNSGLDVLRETRVRMAAGERVLVQCAPFTNRTQLFRALAGLWPWGYGRIERPAHEQILYLPSGTPYLPRGTLREVLAYPFKSDAYDAQALQHALTRMGLARLGALLEETHRWDRELSQDEQLRLVFARALAQRPAWLVMDGTFATFDDDLAVRVLEIFSSDLAQSGLIHIGTAAHARDPLYQRVLHLIKAPIPAPGAMTSALSAHDTAAVEPQRITAPPGPRSFRS